MCFVRVLKTKGIESRDWLDRETGRAGKWTYKGMDLVQEETELDEVNSVYIY